MRRILVIVCIHGLLYNSCMDPQQNAGIVGFGVGGYYPIHAFTVVSVYEAGFDVGDTAPVVLSDGLLVIHGDADWEVVDLVSTVRDDQLV